MSGNVHSGKSVAAVVVYNNNTLSGRVELSCFNLTLPFTAPATE